MLTLKEWMELADYKITEGSDYYGEKPNMYNMSSWNGIHGDGGYSFEIMFDPTNQYVYCVEACDYTNDRAYRLIGDTTLSWDTYAWDDVKWTDLEVDDDFLQKALAIKAGETYDTGIKVPLKLSDEELLPFMKLAHEMDITFNELVEKALLNFIEEFERDPKAVISKTKELVEL